MKILPRACFKYLPAWVSSLVLLLENCREGLKILHLRSAAELLTGFFPATIPKQRFIEKKILHCALIFNIIEVAVSFERLATGLKRASPPLRFDYAESAA